MNSLWGYLYIVTRGRHPVRSTGHALPLIMAPIGQKAEVEFWKKGSGVSFFHQQPLLSSSIVNKVGAQGNTLVRTQGAKPQKLKMI